MANPKDNQEQSDVEVPAPKMKRNEYAKRMRLLHGELVAMQEWVKASGAKICIVFEGRDTAGKGGTSRRLRAAGPAVAVHPDALLDSPGVVRRPGAVPCFR
jgi:polyphosphate kinase 2 (PPK2 family)